MGAKDSKGSRKKRRSNGSALAGTLFTAAMICCCVLIYLLSRGGGDTARDTSIDVPPQPTAQMERVYPAVEVFFERAKGYGFDAEYTEDDGYAPDKGYTLKRGDLDGGELVLSMRSMGVCGFTLILPAAAMPDDLPDDPTPVELSLYEQRLGRYEAESAWLDKSLGSLISGIDVGSEVTYADKTDMLALIWQTAKDGKAKDMDGDWGRFSVSRKESTDGNKICISFLLKD